MSGIHYYRSLMAMRDITGIASEAVIANVGKLIEAAFTLRQTDGVQHAIRLGSALLERDLRPDQSATVHFLLSEAWEKLRVLSDAPVWAWERLEIERELYHLRRAISREALQGMNRERISQILTNMAAVLNHVGRFSEAVEQWDRALTVSPKNAMARGKKGYAITHYAQIVNDRAQNETFLRCAHAELKDALSLGLYEEAERYFSGRLAWIESKVDPSALQRELDLHESMMESTEEEMLYRRWCLENRLFLNPLNDIGPFQMAGADILMVPADVVSGSAFYQGFFNQMKQAYVSSRYLYYDGLNAADVHFSDRGVTLFDTMDYPSYSLSVEKVKVSFGMAYALFHKMAVFLNSYFGLKVPDDRITFKTIWYEGQSKGLGLRPEFRERKNWPLRGIFWLSKDLYEEAPGLAEPIEPDARQLSEINYQLNNRYLKLHDSSHAGHMADTDMPPGDITDRLAYAVHRSDFEAKTLRVLKLVRSALTYLTFAVQIEEKNRRTETPGGGVPMVSFKTLEDRLKV